MTSKTLGRADTSPDMTATPVERCQDTALEYENRFLEDTSHHTRDLDIASFRPMFHRIDAACTR